MARSTLGGAGAAAAGTAYVFLHVALLVAYCAKAAEILSGAAGGAGPPTLRLFFPANASGWDGSEKLTAWTEKTGQMIVAST